MLATRLSMEEYRKQYAHTKGSEYWFGEVRFKSVPTWLHSLLQGLLVQVFTEAGYAAGSELELRIDPEWEPKPDVAASTVVEEPYPTKPIEIAAEILSSTDSMDEVREKCSHYERIGIRRIFVFDPAGKQGFEWRNSNLDSIEEIEFGNGTAPVAVSAIWKELDRRVALGGTSRR